MMASHDWAASSRMGAGRPSSPSFCAVGEVGVGTRCRFLRRGYGNSRVHCREKDLKTEGAGELLNFREADGPFGNTVTVFVDSFAITQGCIGMYMVPASRRVA